MNFLRVYFGFHGRLDRTEYAFVILSGHTLPGIIGQAIIYSTQWDDWMRSVGLLLFLVSVWVLFAAVAKRFHDIDTSAWWCVLLLFPIASLLIEFGLLGFESPKVSNRYGEPHRFIL